ncbi:MAG: nuclear transport factor 2 family protein [Acidimicrobiia bacterium]
MSVYTGRDEIIEIFTGARDRTRDEGGPPIYVRHFTGTHQIDLVDESTAVGRCYYQVLTAIGLDHWGRRPAQHSHREGDTSSTARRIPNLAQARVVVS